MTSPQLNEERNYFFRWLIILGVVQLVILAVMAMGLVANFSDTTSDLDAVQTKQALLTQKLRTSNIISCERGATLVAYEIVEAGQSENPKEEQQQARSLFRIRDCEKSEDQGRSVFLSSAEANAYISGVAGRMGILNWNKTK